VFLEHGRQRSSKAKVAGLIPGYQGLAQTFLPGPRAHGPHTRLVIFLQTTQSVDADADLAP
jgi:hypothetical protein